MAMLVVVEEEEEEEVEVEVLDCHRQQHFLIRTHQYLHKIVLTMVSSHQQLYNHNMARTNHLRRSFSNSSYSNSSM
jgi:hypothetical protein